MPVGCRREAWTGNLWHFPHGVVKQKSPRASAARCLGGTQRPLRFRRTDAARNRCGAFTTPCIVPHGFAGGLRGRQGTPAATHMSDANLRSFISHALVCRPEPCPARSIHQARCKPFGRVTGAGHDSLRRRTIRGQLARPLLTRPEPSTFRPLRVVRGASLLHTTTRHAICLGTELLSAKRGKTVGKRIVRGRRWVCAFCRMPAECSRGPGAAFAPRLR